MNEGLVAPGSFAPTAAAAANDIETEPPREGGRLVAHSVYRESR